MMEDTSGGGSIWHGQLGDQTDVLAAEQSYGQNEFADLSNIFDFGDIDLGDADASVRLDEGGENGQSGQQLQAGDLGQDFMLDESFDMQQHGSTDTQRQQQILAQQQQTQISNNVAFANSKAMFQQAMPQQQYPVQQTPQQGQPQQQSHYQRGVPPTPTSFDLHGDAARFMQHQQQQQAIQQQQFQMANSGTMQFTPLASPIGTPQYGAQSDFTVNPGAYFSPLTSPMIHAQHQLRQQQQQQQHGYHTASSSTAPSSYAPSPVDAGLVDLDMLGESITLPAPAPEQGKKPRRKITTPKSTRGSSKAPKASPAQLPRKRKSGFTASDPTALAPTSSQYLPSSGGLRIPPSSSSDADSISPEPLTDSVMGPPPRPGSSTTASPAIAPQIQEMSLESGSAATPKSLLSGARGQPPSSVQSASSASSQLSPLEDLTLPAAAKPPRPIDLQINTRIQPPSSQEGTPRLSARKTPKLGPESTPSSTRLAPMASPSTTMSPRSATTPGALLKDKKSDSKSGRGGRKPRGNSISQNGPSSSPALMPKISPSIKPLLPEGANLHTSTHALLLASKSNYQNLVEGNILPGVSYPEHLSTGLTSKRTSHKVAEQGRRNRINDALKEMQALLPRSMTSKGSGGGEGSPEDAAAATAVDGIDADGSGSGKVSSKDSKEMAEAKAAGSKAATVESANKYIRELQSENAALLLVKKENEEMRRRLQRMERSAGTNASAANASSSSSSSAENGSATPEAKSIDGASAGGAGAGGGDAAAGATTANGTANATTGEGEME